MQVSLLSTQQGLLLLPEGMMFRRGVEKTRVVGR